MNIALEFIQRQKALSITARNEDDMWVANVFVGVGDDERIYFIGPKNARHSSMIQANPHVVFSSVWFQEGDHTNRKGIQGKGLCRLAENEEEIETGVRLHNHHYPEFKDRITMDWIHNNESESRVWVLIPSFIKYWDDEKYGSAMTEEFTFTI